MCRFIEDEETAEGLPVEQLSDGPGTVLTGTPDSRLNVSEAIRYPFKLIELYTVLLVEFDKDQLDAYVTELSVKDALNLGAYGLHLAQGMGVLLLMNSDIDPMEFQELLIRLQTKVKDAGVTEENAREYVM